MNEQVRVIAKDGTFDKIKPSSELLVCGPSEGKDEIKPKALAGIAKVTDKQMLAWLIANSTLVAYPATKTPDVAQGFAVIFEVPATVKHSNDLLSVLAGVVTHSTTT